MGGPRYELLSHREVGDLAAQVYDLAALAFGTYPGVLQPSRAHREWYVRRPGMSAELSQAMVCGDRVVSSVFVTMARMRLFGEVRPVGILDTVMTHPEHRRRHLASAVVGEALAGIRARGLVAALLYTLDGSMPFRMYGGMGFRPHARVAYWRRPEADTTPGGGARRVEPHEHARLQALLNAWHAGVEGHIPLDDALWRWRKVARPAELPAQVWLLERCGKPLGTATLCRAPIVSEGGARAAWFLTDLATDPDADRRAAVEELLRIVPAGEARTLTADTDEDASRALRAAGYERVAVEVAMIRACDEGLRAAPHDPPRGWYPLAESIVGL